MLIPPPGKYTNQPVERVGVKWDGPRVQDILREMNLELLRLRAVLDANGLSASSGGGSSSSSIIDEQGFVWCANGPYRVDTAVDGGRVVPATCVIQSIWFYRTTAGSSGSTTLDVNKNGTTLYTTQANRPTITYSDTDQLVICSMPDVLNLPMSSVLTVDTDSIEDGTPEHWVLLLRAA